MKAYFELFLFLVPSLLFICSNGHPQCLDYYPPFRSSKDLSLCWYDRSFGCCTVSRDKDMMYDFLYVVGRIKYNKNSVWCKEAIRKIICAECHPYAAHIYDAEKPVQSRTKSKLSLKNARFPGLCLDFCYSVFELCLNSLLSLPIKQSLNRFIRNSTKETFCKWAHPGDKDYCIPNVQSARKKVTRYSSNSEKVIQLCVEDVAHSFRNPLVAVHSNDGTNRFFVGEQKGVIYVLQLLKNGKRMKRAFLNIEDRVLNSGQSWDERGFLGLVFHPNYAENGRFFVYYSAINEGKPPKPEDEERNWYYAKYKHRIRISEFIVSAHDPNVANPDSEIVLLEVDEPEPNHEGGMLLFGDDGYLYIFIGDGGGGGDMHGKIGNALNMTTLLGKVLRINVDVADGRPYSIPTGNPFLKNKMKKPEIFAYGVRNMWRCSKDRGDRRTGANKGRIFCGDVGQFDYEEIDIIVNGGNYGWAAREGFSCYDRNLCRSSLVDNAIPPIIAYNHSIGKSVVGGYVYRGCQNPNIRGLYIYGDTDSGRLFAAKENKKKGWISKDIIMGNSSICNNGLHGNYHINILSFAEDEMGELYVLSTPEPDSTKPIGNIYRLVDPFRREDPEKCKVNPKHPRRLKGILPRKVNAKYRRKKPTPSMKSVCIDKRKVCKHFKKIKWLCDRHKRFAKKFCKKTCNFC